MRKALNENPLVQVGVLGLLAIVVGFFFLTRMGGGAGDEAVAPTAAPPAADATAPATAAPPVPGAAAPSAPAAEPTAGEFKAGPGLPEAVVRAYDANQVVVLLIANPKGVDDQKLMPAVAGLRADPDTAVFFVAPNEVSAYARITQGVELERTPALVVLRQKSLASTPRPEASVLYGFRGPASVVQAVEDARYDGRDDLSYSP